MGEYSNFLLRLSEQLTSGECGNLAYIAGVVEEGAGESPVRGRSCCCRCRCNSVPACSPGLALLRRLERVGVFSRGCLGPLANVLEEIGRKDLAKKCESAGKWTVCCGEN